VIDEILKFAGRARQRAALAKRLKEKTD